jgi:hypothetical protein
MIWSGAWYALQAAVKRIVLSVPDATMRTIISSFLFFADEVRRRSSQQQEACNEYDVLLWWTEPWFPI